MKTVEQTIHNASSHGTQSVPDLTLRQLNRMRVGYLVMGLGLAIVKWPLLLDGKTWELKEGTVNCMLVALSILALLGLRYPSRMVPVLLFEVGWKLTWLAAVALPLWSAGKLDDATRNQVSAVLWFVIVIAAIPWRHVLRRYVLAAGEPWRGHEL
jgi:hypothetical protein